MDKFYRISVSTCSVFFESEKINNFNFNYLSVIFCLVLSIFYSVEIFFDESEESFAVYKKVSKTKFSCSPKITAC
jgi:hypothetical protein